MNEILTDELIEKLAEEYLEHKFEKMTFGEFLEGMLKVRMLFLRL